MVVELSRKAVLALVAIAVVLSFLSTTFVLFTVNTISVPEPTLQDGSSPNAQVNLFVPPSAPAGQVVIEVPKTEDG